MRDAPLFDSHCHIDFEAFDADREEVLAEAREAGVVGMVVAGVHPSGWPRIAALSQGHPDVHATCGIHPQELPRLTEDELAEGLAALPGAASRLGAVAIGETGFDRATKDRGVGFEAQGLAVDAHRDAAEVARLPVILHILGAHGAALAHLEGRGPFPHGGVVHSYSGSAELVPRYVALGLHISFAGSIVRPGASRSRAAAAAVPGERLLIETDAPDQPLHDAASRRNEPTALLRIAAAVAAARGEAVDGLDGVAARTTENARRLFGLPSA